MNIFYLSENSQNQRRPDQRQFGGPRPQSSGGPRPQSGRGGYGYRGRGGGYRGRGQGRPRSPRKDYPQDGKGNNSNVNSSQWKSVYLIGKKTCLLCYHINEVNKLYIPVKNVITIHRNVICF